MRPNDLSWTGSCLVCAVLIASASNSGCSTSTDKDEAGAGAGGSAQPAGAGMNAAGASAGNMAMSDGSGPTRNAGNGGASSAGSSGANADPDAGMMHRGDSGMADSDAGPLPHTMQPIDPPVEDDCITDVTAGDHTFSCSGLTFLVMVDEMCTKLACGLIFDTHGATMSGAQMRDNTNLQKLAPSKGYLVVHPSATASNTGGTWDLTNDPPKVADFMDRMMKAFHVDLDRVHFTGFSQGGGMSWWFLCNHNEWLASAAPVAGALNTEPCMDADWSPRVPILNMNGIDDQASVIANSRTLIMGVVDVLGLHGGDEIEGDGHYSIKHWESDDGMVLDSIEHDYGGQAVLGGHCIPGGEDIPGAANNFSLNATTCTTGDPKLNWGEYVLQWFIDHPRLR